MSRQARRALAAETMAILDSGSYVAPSGRTVSIAERITDCVRGTQLHLPGESLPPMPVIGQPARIEVTAETTLAAGRRLAAGGPVACLNFASAKNPGGGFLSGAQAQEEALARSSGLYASLRQVPEFYEAHRALRDPLYSDRVIYSPRVPVFRDDEGALLEEPCEVAILTCAAPNRGASAERHDSGRFRELLQRRAARVLAAALYHGHRRLVLGAWGCGVFRNDPEQVAEVFADLLHGEYAARFTEVAFAVWDTAPGAPRHAAFARTFAPVSRGGSRTG